MSKFDDYLEEEESFFSNDKKLIKKQKKIKSKKDKSKYKKTNIEKPSSKDNKNFAKGRILAISGQEILVEKDSKKYICVLRGILKKEKTRNKNIIAVGDIVYFSIKGQLSVIEDIEKRYSILSRHEEMRQKQHIIAVNIDQVLITSSVVIPPLKPHLVDRYIIASKKGGMSAVIVINKIDLLKKNKEAESKYKEFLKIYEEMGYPILSISCKDKTGLDSLLNIMKGKASVFSGQSGTGKSSIINEVLKTNLKTGEVLHKRQKGAHITTKAELIEIPTGGFCIDTPGIKSFGIWELNIEDVKLYFSEILKFSKSCKYKDCNHIKEPSCAVLEALEEGEISELRYNSYLSLIEEIIEKEAKKYD